jgi:predicted nicotinamide N-methyase
MNIHYDLSKLDEEYYNYFIAKSGLEHYRLLSHISSLVSNEKILDIGTNRGYSALALSSNSNNQVVSYDLVRYDNITKVINSNLLKNVEFKIGDFLDSENIHESKIIFLDTLHDGVFEYKVICYLKRNNWNGLLIMDDIHAFKELNVIWNNTTLEKYDLTRIGHASGTGLIVFN